ncbi:uncharacterized protein LOC112509139 [Cynara cardunculus var. scolymus]|uniref:uncharacterized protein LOC112509139 n=1 Tax=Cynara cardunculus var. scolymus TaxID=59895 RepID=UPI000D622F9D|nr:uncharacterized protein LOC112509139 [Cynara cardunculus var. scolymus]
MDPNCSISDRISISENGLTFLWNWRRPIRDGREQRDLISIISLCENFRFGSCDKWRCDLDKSGVFSVAPLRKAIDSMALRRCGPPTMWLKTVPTKIRMFIWRGRLDRLSTKVNLIKRGVHLEDDLCPPCKEYLETINHILLECRKAVDVRRNIKYWADWIPDSVSSINDLLFFGQSPELGQL